MKFTLVFCAVLGLSFGASVHHGHRNYATHNEITRNLGDLLKELMTLIPVDKITDIVIQHLESDPEVQEAFAYLKSDDFKKMVTTVENSQQFKDLAAFLDGAGLDIYEYIKFINDLLGIPNARKHHHHHHHHHHYARSLMSMINEILDVLPLDEIKQFYHDKIENDPEFQELLKRMRSPEFKQLAEAVRNMPEFADMLERLKKHGIDVDTIMQKINDFFGWGFYSIQTRNLGDLLNELLEMIPVDKIIEIVTDYIANDAEVQEAVAFLKSDEFKSLVEKIQNMPQYMEYLEYLYNAGIDVYKYINYVHGLLGLPPVHRPGSFRHSTRSLMGMIQDILNVLPLEDMKKFYHEKVENDPDFQALLAKLKSDEFKNIVETIRNMPEYIDMMDRLKSHGIDVDAIRKKINDFFGWGFYSIQTRNLGDLLNELLEMIPVDKIIEIVTDYIANDAEVQEAVAFLKSDEFKSLVEKIQNMPQYMEYLEYLYNAGIDVYKYINYVHGLLGLPPVHRPGSFRHSTRSLMGMIQDILNVLPLEDMKKFYHEKVENDPDFQALLAKLKSDEFKNIVETIRNMPEYIDMMDRLKSHGIDVDAIRKKINDFFGWGFYSIQTRNLGDLLNELLEMIPVDKIIEIVTDYIANDAEVQEAVAFLKSDEFKSLVEKIQNMPQYMEYLEYLYNAGIDVYKYINYVHGLLGLPPVHRPGSFRHSTRSLMGMIQDILNVLPLEDMKKFYHEKVENDPDFQALLAKLKSDEFKNIVETIRNMPEYIDMMDRLKSHGIDVDAIRKKINDFFGWGFYSIQTRNLGDLLNELLEMIPVDKIIEIVTDYIANDAEVQEAVAFLKSDEFKSLVEKIQNMPQYMEYLEYLYNAGIDVYKYINYVHGLLGLPPVHRPGSFRHSTRSLMGMIQDILNVLPLEDMKKFYHEKVENDPDFQALLAKLKSDEFKNIVETIRNMPEYIDMMDRLKSHGIDVDAIRKKINDFFGW